MFLSFDQYYTFKMLPNFTSPEDKRKIVQIDDTITIFNILDPLHVGNDLR